MEKSLRVYLDDKPVEKLLVTEKTDIRSIKSYLKKYKNVIPKFYIDKHTEMPVFNTDKYDNRTLKSIFDKLEKSFIILKTKLFEKLPIDAIYLIALELDLPSLLNLCSTDSRINNKICRKKHIWLKLLDRDFPDRQQLTHNPKDLYILLWNQSLTDLKKQLNLKEDIYTLYSLKKLDLSRKKLTKLPSSIRFLTNLQELDVSRNQLKELPDNLPNSLQKLDAEFNQLNQLPNHLPDSLQILYVEFNQLKMLPDRLPSSLQKLYASFNQLKELPDNLPLLQTLGISNNQLKKLPDNLPNTLFTLSLKNNQLEENEINRIKIRYPKIFLLSI